jgi:hypothetical protein
MQHNHGEESEGQRKELSLFFCFFSSVSSWSEVLMVMESLLELLVELERELRNVEILLVRITKI